MTRLDPKSSKSGRKCPKFSDPETRFRDQFLQEKSTPPQRRCCNVSLPNSHGWSETQSGVRRATRSVVDHHCERIGGQMVGCLDLQLGSAGRPRNCFNFRVLSVLPDSPESRMDSTD